MTLVEAIDESMRLGEAYTRSESLADILSEAKVLQTKIKENVADYFRALQDYYSMSKASIMPKGLDDDMMRLLGDIKESVLSGEYESDRVVSLNRECKSLQESVDDSWKRYIRKEIGTQKDIVDVLQALINDTQRYLTLKGKYSEIISAPIPGEESAIAQVKTYRTLANNLISELGLEDSILKFFQKLANAEVLPLSALTPDVWKWICDNNFEGKFTIKICDK